MNAARITGAAALGFALAFGAAQAQDAKTTPYQEQKAVEKSDATKTPSAKTETSPSSSALESSAAVDKPQQPMAQQPMAQQPARDTKADARTSGGSSSIARLAKLEDFDKNKDGSIAKDEAPANDQLALNFQTYDKDGDGKISQAEFALYKNGNRLASNKPAKAKQESKPQQQ